MKFLVFLKKYRDLIYIALIIVAVVIISLQHSKVSNLNNEIDRQENNNKALTEQLVNYEDELGRINAEKHAYQLTQEELQDSIGLLKRKNIEYLSYINSSMNIKDTVRIETVITKEVAIQIDCDTITMNRQDTFGKSSRKISMEIPYSVKEDKLQIHDATFALEQNIFVEGWLERNKKTKETYVHLRSDYPGLIFNSGMGVIADSGKAYEKTMRKSCGIGLCVGPNIGFNYDFYNQKVIPTVGVGITVGFTYTPKFLQW